MGIRLGTLLLSIFFLIGFLILSIFHYNHKYQTQYKIRNMFPYELNYNAHFLDNGAGNLVMILMTVSLITFFILFDQHFTFPFYIPISVAGGLFAFIIPFIVLVPLKNLRAHIFVLVLELVLAVALPGTIGIASWQIAQKFGTSIYTNISLFGSLFTALIVLILVFNPNLSLMIKYSTIKKEDGTEERVRPKVIFLALVEWLLIFSIFTDAILVFVLMLA